MAVLHWIIKKLIWVCFYIRNTDWGRPRSLKIIAWTSKRSEKKKKKTKKTIFCVFLYLKWQFSYEILGLIQGIWRDYMNKSRYKGIYSWESKLKGSIYRECWEELKRWLQGMGVVLKRWRRRRRSCRNWRQWWAMGINQMRWGRRGWAPLIALWRPCRRPRQWRRRRRRGKETERRKNRAALFLREIIRDWSIWMWNMFEWLSKFGIWL